MRHALAAEPVAIVEDANGAFVDVAIVCRVGVRAAKTMASGVVAPNGMARVTFVSENGQKTDVLFRRAEGTR